MTDFYQAHYEYWFTESCRQSRLIGGITACVAATQADATFTLTPAEAIARISQLVTDFDAETTRQRSGGSR